VLYRGGNQKKGKENLKRGVGSQRQASVGVAVESVPLEDLKTGKKSRACGYYKMEVMGKVDADHVNKFIKKMPVATQSYSRTKTVHMLTFQTLWTHITW
jgi:hypothetical protein